MNRLQFGLTLFAAGFCLAFVGSRLINEQKPPWDAREDGSVLLNQQANLPAPRDFHVDTKPTLSKWQRPRITHAVGKSSFAAGQPRGVKISLVSLFEPVSTFTNPVESPDADPLNNCTFSSVTSGGANNSCSTSAGAAATSCSVNGTNGGQSTASCSTTSGSGGTYCSANAGGNANLTACSSFGAGGAKGNACSAGSAPIVGGTPQPVTCSISASQNPGAGATNCSAGLTAGSTNTTCSSSSASGAAAPSSSGSCSASNADPNGNQNNHATGSCSVAFDGQGNSCSTTQGSGSTCSVISTGPGNMTCSIQSTFTQAKCTANYPQFGTNPGGASCSAQPVSAGGCSVINPNGSVTAPTGNTGFCAPPPAPTT
jgi:hypothetical protein